MTTEYKKWYLYITNCLKFRTIYRLNSTPPYPPPLKTGDVQLMLGLTPYDDQNFLLSPNLPVFTTEQSLDYKEFFKFLTKGISLNDILFFYEAVERNRIPLRKELYSSSIKRCPVGYYLKELLETDLVFTFHGFFIFEYRTKFFKVDTTFEQNEHLKEFLIFMDFSLPSRHPLDTESIISVIRRFMNLKGK